MKKTFQILSVLIVVVIAGLVFTLTGKQQTTGNSILGNNPITVYKSQSCGCCDQYVGYLKGQGIQVNVQTTDNMDSIKLKYGIPTSMQSCHTSVIGNYFVEGHVPVEAINKLIEEGPNIKGIAMPGMPTGSPGMGGVKNSPFVVYSISESGTSEFVKI